MCVRHEIGTLLCVQAGDNQQAAKAKGEVEQAQHRGSLWQTNVVQPRLRKKYLQWSISELERLNEVLIDSHRIRARVVRGPTRRQFPFRGAVRPVMVSKKLGHHGSRPVLYHNLAPSGKKAQTFCVGESEPLGFVTNVQVAQGSIFLTKLFLLQGAGDGPSKTYADARGPFRFPDPPMFVGLVSMKKGPEVDVAAAWFWASGLLLRVFWVAPNSTPKRGPSGSGTFAWHPARFTSTPGICLWVTSLSP